MHHFFVDPSSVSDGRVELSGGDAYHAARVLRVRAGEPISVADGSGRMFEAVVTTVGDVVAADVTTMRVVEPPSPSLVLCQGVAKGERMDDVVRKAVEVGVSRITPFLAERSVVRWDTARQTKAHERWTAVADAAAKQCRSPWVTEVTCVLSGVAEVAATPDFAVALHESAIDRLRDVLPEERPESVTLVVGPEGGLSSAEVEVLRSGGAAVASLGPRILRTETAGPVAAALVSYAYGNLG